MEGLIGNVNSENTGLFPMALYKNRMSSYSLQSNNILELSINKSASIIEGYLLHIQGGVVTTYLDENISIDVTVTRLKTNKILYPERAIEIRMSPDKNKIYIQGKMNFIIVIKIECLSWDMSIRNIGTIFPEDSIPI